MGESCGHSKVPASKPHEVLAEEQVLRDEKILPEGCYQVLKLASNVRNNIHVDPAVLAMIEKDLELFRYAHQIAYQIQFAKSSDWFPEDPLIS